MRRQLFTSRTAPDTSTLGACTRMTHTPSARTIRTARGISPTIAWAKAIPRDVTGYLSHSGTRAPESHYIFEGGARKSDHRAPAGSEARPWSVTWTTARDSCRASEQCYLHS